MTKHCAYNLSTGEAIICESGNALKRLAKITSNNDRKRYGIHDKWIFNHEGIKSMIAKINKIEKMQ